MTTADELASFNMMPVKEWPLRFKSHSFSAFTYETYGAKVIYAGQRQVYEPDNEMQRSSDSYGPDYQRNWSGVHGMIPNFQDPAIVSWRSKDGTHHSAEIDFAEIFSDEVIRHNVRREEIPDLPDGAYRNEPSIILEVNDRTVRVYMRAYIPTKAFQKPGNAYSNFRYDLVLVKIHTF